MRIIHVTVALATLVIAAGVGCSSEPDAGQGEPRDEPLGESQEAIGTCAHPRCSTGAALAPSCDPCVASICAADPFCCSTAWDGACVAQVATVCSKTCTCPHPSWEEGVALGDACSDCVKQICNVDPFCCNVEWDALCVEHSFSASTTFDQCWPQ